MEKRNKRVIISRKGGPEDLQIVEEDLIDPIPGEVRIKVLTAGVLFTDILWESGKVPGGPKHPFTPGYDLVGVVDKLGDGVSDLKVDQTALIGKLFNLSNLKLMMILNGRRCCIKIK